MGGNQTKQQIEQVLENYFTVDVSQTIVQLCESLQVSQNSITIIDSEGITLDGVKLTNRINEQIYIDTVASLAEQSTNQAALSQALEQIQEQTGLMSFNIANIKMVNHLRNDLHVNVDMSTFNTIRKEYKNLNSMTFINDKRINVKNIDMENVSMNEAVSEILAALKAKADNDAAAKQKDKDDQKSDNGLGQLAIIAVAAVLLLMMMQKNGNKL